MEMHLAGGRALDDRHQLFIGGRWVDPAGAERSEVVCPSDERVLATVPVPTEADADRALAAARAALDGPWGSATLDERIAVMERITEQIELRRDAFNLVFSSETGGAVATSAGLTEVALMIWRDYVRVARDFRFDEERPSITGPVRVHKEPVGVAVGISPWNAPVAGVAFILAPAIAAGCTVVLKPAHEVPLAMYLLADAVAAADVPEGVVSILPGGRELGDYLVRHPLTDKVALTGSTVAGRSVMAAAASGMKRVTLELGGKSPAIIADDADLDLAIPILVKAATDLSGQVCAALTRIVVSEARHDEVVVRLRDAMADRKVGDALDPDTEVGPLALERQRERVESYIAAGLAEGATLVLGGGRPEGLEKGWFVEPTIFADVRPDMKIAREEIFGPVVSVIKYHDLEEAIAIANDSDYGLNASVFSTDPRTADFVTRRIRSGQVHINGYGTSPGAPFGGFKMSGIGRKGGPEGLDAYLETKVVQVH